MVARARNQLPCHSRVYPRLPAFPNCNLSHFATTIRPRSGKPGLAMGMLLPDKMLMSADALATHLRCSREPAVSAAIADQMVKLGLAQRLRAGRERYGAKGCKFSVEDQERRGRWYAP